MQCDEIMPTEEELGATTTPIYHPNTRQGDLVVYNDKDHVRTRSGQAIHSLFISNLIEFASLYFYENSAYSSICKNTIEIILKWVVY